LESDKFIMATLPNYVSTMSNLYLFNEFLFHLIVGSF